MPCHDKTLLRPSNLLQGFFADRINRLRSPNDIAVHGVYGKTTFFSPQSKVIFDKIERQERWVGKSVRAKGFWCRSNSK